MTQHPALPPANSADAPSNPDTSDSAVEFLRIKADDMGTRLPPLGKLPRRWPAMLTSPQGTPSDFPGTQRGFMGATIRTNWGPVLVQTLAMSVGTVIGALLPFVLGRSIDSAIDVGLTAPTWQWIGIFFVLTLIMSMGDGLHQLGEVASYLGGALNPARSVAHRISRGGRATKQEKPAGDVVTGMLTDSSDMGEAVLFVSEVLSSLAAIVVVTIVMFMMSPPLALFVVIGLPLVLAVIALLVKPMQRKTAVVREEQGKLTTISTDAVMGLRVLRGVGGEGYYNRNYREQSQRVKDASIKVAGNHAALAVIRTSLPQLFVAVVTGYGAFLTFQGNITPGDLVAFAGMTAYLSTPFAVAGNAAVVGTRSWVGAKKLAEFHSVEPLTSDELVEETSPEQAETAVPFGSLPLVDLATGITIRPGRLTALVAPSPAVAADLAKRLSRVDDRHEVQVGETDLRTLPLEEVRAGILLSEDDAQLFSGPLYAGLRGRFASPPPSRDVTELVYREHIEEAARHEGTLFRPDRLPEDPRLYRAMEVADADDVLDSLAGGMAGWLTERGRNLSGGQRQRVALARAVYANAPVFIAIEPTSAVDSHTEERISTRIQAERRGKTTVVVTASPLWLEKCDEVIVMDEDGRERIRGTHADLQREAREGDPNAIAYRRIVERETGGKK